MPGIDFTLLRRQLPLTQVLDLLGFAATTRRGPQVGGPCLLHGRAAPHSRSFAAHLEKNCWHCFRCGSGGNALDLYLAVTKLPVYDGALELCARLHLPVPRLVPGAAVSPARKMCQRDAYGTVASRRPP